MYDVPISSIITSRVHDRGNVIFMYIVHTSSPGSGGFWEAITKHIYSRITQWSFTYSWCHICPYSPQNLSEIWYDHYRIATQSLTDCEEVQSCLIIALLKNICCDSVWYSHRLILHWLGKLYGNMWFCKAKYRIIWDAGLLSKYGQVTAMHSNIKFCLQIPTSWAEY